MPTVTVTRTAPDVLVLSWRGPTPARVVVATDRPGGPPEVEIALNGGDDSVTVEGPAAEGRRYWTVSGDGWTAEGAERRVALEGPMNFRDLGGYPVEGGGTTRWGLLFRSDNLASLTDGDWGVLRGLGLRAIYDLRYPEECERQPSRHDPAASYDCVGLPIGEAGGEATDVLDDIMSGRITEIGVDFMVDLYQRLLVEHAREFGRLVTLLADAERLPAAFHCTAGKDRTGMATALVLRALGVAEEIVLDDYELSNEYRAKRRIEELRPRLEAAGVDVERVRPFLSAPRSALATALSTIEDDHGGAEAFLTGPAAVDADVLDALRGALIAR